MIFQASRAATLPIHLAVPISMHHDMSRMPKILIPEVRIPWALPGEAHGPRRPIRPIRWNRCKCNNNNKFSNNSNNNKHNNRYGLKITINLQKRPKKIKIARFRSHLHSYFEKLHCLLLHFRQFWCFYYWQNGAQKRFLGHICSVHASFFVKQFRNFLSEQEFWKILKIIDGSHFPLQLFSFSPCLLKLPSS